SLGGNGCGNELFRCFIVGIDTKPIADESCRLHLSDHPQHVSAIIFLLVTQAVEPDERNGSVASEQFTQLELHVGKIALPLRALWLTMQFSLVGRWYRGIWGGAG